MTLLLCIVAYVSVAFYQVGAGLGLLLAFGVVLVAWPAFPILLLVLGAVFVFSGPGFGQRLGYINGVMFLAIASLTLLVGTVVVWKKGSTLGDGRLQSSAVLGWFVNAWFWAYMVVSLLVHGVDD